MLLLGEAGLAFVKARPAVLAATAMSPAPAGSTAVAAPNPVAALLAGDTPGYLGVAFVGIGVLQLLFGLIVGDLLPAAAFIAAGVYVAADLLPRRGVLKPALYEQVRGLGVPVAAAAAAAAVLHLVLGAYWLF